VLKVNRDRPIRRIERISTSRDIESRAANVRLAEYTKLKDEVTNRSTLQSTLITLNIVAAGALGGIVISKRGNILILLLLPPLSSALGLLWLDHAQTIARIGDYIRSELFPHLVEWNRYPGDPESYEEVVRKTSALDVATYLVPCFIIFIGPSIASAAATVHAVNGIEEWTFWGADVLITFYCFSIWMMFLHVRASAVGTSAPILRRW
jgi:hypothetical protein